MHKRSCFAQELVNTTHFQCAELYGFLERQQGREHVVAKLHEAVGDHKLRSMVHGKVSSSPTGSDLTSSASSLHQRGLSDGVGGLAAAIAAASGGGGGGAGDDSPPAQRRPS